MFRRDKDTRMDDEGLRRMREAIRQRLDQEERSVQGDAPGDAEAQTLPGIESSAPPAESAPSSGGETEYSWGHYNRSLLGNAQTVTDLPATPQQPWSPPVPQQQAAPVNTTVAVGTNWNGTLRSGDPVRIEGNFHGEIDTESDLYVAADAAVEATVRAAAIVVAGDLSGNISCGERLEVLPSGRVTGQIEASRFVVHEGAYLGGQVRMKPRGEGGDDDPTRPVLQRVR